jgi:hypothetical protein
MPAGFAPDEQPDVCRGSTAKGHRRAGLGLQSDWRPSPAVTTWLSQDHGEAKRGLGCSSAGGACHLATF